MIKAVIFDYDGVLVDSLKPLFLCWKKITHDLDANVKITDIEQYKKLFMNNVVAMLESVGLSEKDLDFSKDAYFESLEKNPVLIFDGIKELLSSLAKKYRLAIVSGSNEKVIKDKLSEFGILDFFELIVVAVDQTRNKPDPFYVKLAIEKLSIKPEEVIYIGDTIEDIIAARRAGIKNIIGVSYGIGTCESISAENPTIIVDSPEKILDAIGEIESE